MRLILLLSAVLLFALPTDCSAQNLWLPTFTDIGRLETGFVPANPPGATAADSYKVFAADAGLEWQIGPVKVPATTTAMAVVGFGQFPTPFKGGTLIPTPDLLVVFQTTFAENAIFIIGEPSHSFPGQTLFMQFWVVDPLGPGGVGATGTLIWTAQ